MPPVDKDKSPFLTGSKDVELNGETSQKLFDYIGDFVFKFVNNTDPKAIEATVLPGNLKGDVVGISIAARHINESYPKLLPSNLRDYAISVGTLKITQSELPLHKEYAQLMALYTILDILPVLQELKVRYTHDQISSDVVYAVAHAVSQELFNIVSKNSIRETVIHAGNRSGEPVEIFMRKAGSKLVNPGEKISISEMYWLLGHVQYYFEMGGIPPKVGL
jgi:hypothetical protein